MENDASGNESTENGNMTVSARRGNNVRGGGKRGGDLAKAQGRIFWIIIGVRYTYMMSDIVSSNRLK